LTHRANGTDTDIIANNTLAAHRRIGSRLLRSVTNNREIGFDLANIIGYIFLKFGWSAEAFKDFFPIGQNAGQARDLDWRSTASAARWPCRGDWRALRSDQRSLFKTFSSV
jgi:hypothetical protein